MKNHYNREGIDDLDMESLCDWNDDFSEDLLSEKRRQLKELLKKLSPKEYEVLMKIIVNEKKYKEVAQEMEVSVNTVKMHLKRAMKKLRSEGLLLFIYFF